MDLQKIGMKFFAEKGNTINLVDFIPVFHHWIQNRALDHLLIDVADYSHLHAGPGIVLVAHEGNYSIDETGGRRGVVYYSKREPAGDMQQRLATVCRRVVKACRLLEEEESLQGQLKFYGNELQIFANDRLAAPNTEQTMKILEPALKEFLDGLFPDNPYSLDQDDDPKERFSVIARAAAPVSIETLLVRLSQ
jgi:hypothetical protein